MNNSIKKFRSLNHVEMVAEELMNREFETGFGDHLKKNVFLEGYTFKWDTAKRRFGRCTSSSNVKHRVISLSKLLTEKNLNNGDNKIQLEIVLVQLLKQIFLIKS